MRIVFAGTPGFAIHALDALLSCPDCELVGVVTQPDRRAGRGMRMQPSPVKQLALMHGLDTITPTSLRGNVQALNWLREKRPDFLVVVAFGMLLPVSWLEVPRMAPVNVHASLLPRWRGAAPIERALLAGDRETGVCIMHMEQGLDTGGIYARRVVPITPTTTGGELWQRLAHEGAELLVETLPRIVSGLKPVPQADQGVSYAAKITAEDRLVDWRKHSAIQCDRKVRCFFPRPGARCTWQGRWLKLLAGKPLEERTDADPGTILALNDGMKLACAGGSVYGLNQVQPEGKKPMDALAFARGARLQAGMSLH
ncbi:MAG: methionyl-tRNA formyltransferase [Zetaproteobacteria bacterium]|nr:MAG: methionyl-tRNA formyltransferase [Zetaproteobacteria bacterium]